MTCQYKNKGTRTRIKSTVRPSRGAGTLVASIEYPIRTALDSRRPGGLAASAQVLPESHFC